MSENSLGTVTHFSPNSIKPMKRGIMFCLFMVSGRPPLTSTKPHTRTEEVFSDHVTLTFRKYLWENKAHMRPQRHHRYVAGINLTYTSMGILSLCANIQCRQSKGGSRSMGVYTNCKKGCSERDFHHHLVLHKPFTLKEMLSFTIDLTVNKGTASSPLQRGFLPVQGHFFCKEAYVRLIGNYICWGYEYFFTTQQLKGSIENLMISTVRQSFHSLWRCSFHNWKRIHKNAESPAVLKQWWIRSMGTIH